MKFCYNAVKTRELMKKHTTQHDTLTFYLYLTASVCVMAECQGVQDQCCYLVDELSASYFAPD